jgi:hypothetical protein
MEKSGELHPTAAFTPQGKSPWYPLDRNLGGPQSRSGRDGEEIISQPPPGIEPWNPDRPARSPALYRLNYHGSYLNECGLQLNRMYRFLEGMLIPNVIKIHAASGKQFYVDRMTSDLRDRK